MTGSMGKKRCICHASGCMRTSEEGCRFCAKHSGLEDAYVTNRIFTFRGKSAEWNGLYRTARWRRERREFLGCHPLCSRCGADATIVDHIVPHRGDPALFWDRSNWQPLCQSCHSAKTLRENGGFNRNR